MTYRAAEDAGNGSQGLCDFGAVRPVRKKTYFIQLRGKGSYIRWRGIQVLRCRD